METQEDKSRSSGRPDGINALTKCRWPGRAGID
jgi:hypothetical protein